MPVSAEETESIPNLDLCIGRLSKEGCSARIPEPLKREATGTEEWDVHVWWTLRERLDAAGYETRWMHAHVELRCPECRSRLKYEKRGAGQVVARCGTNCTDDGTDRLLEIRTIVADLYSRTFDKTIDLDSELLTF